MSRPPTDAGWDGTTVLFDVWMLMHLANGLLDESLADNGLSADDFGLYSILANSEGVTPTQLARWTGMRPTTLSAALKRMAGRGDITRMPNPLDARSSLIRLSDRGHARYQAARPAFRRMLEQLHLALGPAEREIRLSLQRLDAALREQAGLDARPYRVEEVLTPESGEAETWQLAYTGAPLTPEEETDALRYLDWVRANRRRPTSDPVAESSPGGHPASSVANRERSSRTRANPAASEVSDGHS